MKSQVNKKSPAETRKFKSYKEFQEAYFPEEKDKIELKIDDPKGSGRRLADAVVKKHLRIPA